MALEGYLTATDGPDTVSEGLSITSRTIELAERIGDKERLYEGHYNRLNALWMHGERAAVAIRNRTKQQAKEPLYLAVAGLRGSIHSAEAAGP